METEMSRAVAYYRVSTERQGRSGLGLDAQRAAVERMCRDRGLSLVAEFTEVETGTGKRARPQLDLAIQAARLQGAMLVIAKVDRLMRNTRFLLTLIDGGTEVAFGDLPNVNGAMGRFMLTQMAAVAELEAGLVSERTKAALAAAKARGQRLGNPNGAAALRRASKGNGASIQAIKQGADEFAEGLRGTVEALKARGVATLKGLAVELNAAHIRTPRGGTWHPSSVRNLLQRLEV